jgi:exopolyphosphatase/guanosine-5'-triphosphate,3'-diphosphate pyrophosphatase
VDRLPDLGAAIDIGSNSVHLLVAEIGVGQLIPRIDESQILGLGAHVDLEGHIGAQHGAEAIRLLTEYVALARDSSAGSIVLMGTEPLRRAADRSAFCRDVVAAVGLPLDVLSHDEEALLTVLGVLGHEPTKEPTLIVDIGGGSSELVLLEPGSDPVVGVLPVGSARLTAAHVEADPPTAQEVAALRSEARHLTTAMPVGRPTRGIVVGGSGSNLLHLLSRIEGDDEPAASRPRLVLSDRRIDRDRARRAVDIIMSRPSRELADAVGLRERRVLQMAAGASIIEAVLDSYGLDQLEASDASLREGAILARAMAGERWLEQVGRLVTGQ